MKKIYDSIFFIGILFFANISASQDNTQTFDSLQTKDYNYLKKNYGNYYSRNTKRANLYANAFLRRAYNEKDSNRITEAYYYLSFINPYKIAISYIDSALAYDKYAKNWNATLYLKEGSLHYLNGDFKKTLNSYLNAKQHAEEQNQYLLYPKIEHNIGLIKMRLGDYKGALTTFQKNYNHIIKSDFNKSAPHYYLKSINNLSIIHHQLKDIDSATYYINLSFKESKKYKSLYNLNEAKIIEGQINYSEGNYLKSRDSIIKYLPLIEKSQDSFDLSLSHFFLGKSHMKLKEWNKAIEQFKKTDTIIHTKGTYTIELKENYNILFNYYKENGDTKNQLLYLEKLLNFDSILYTDNTYLNKTLLSEYDIPKLTKEKDLLIEELQQVEVSKSKTVYILTFLCILFLCIAMYYYFKRTTYKRRFEALLKNNTQKLTVVKNPKSSTTIPDYLVDKILEKVLTFEKERGYLDSSITLNSMAKKLETNSNYLSKVVNLTKGRNFSTYISDLRINYTVEALKNQPKLREYTVKAIANEVGFNNTESFTKAFYKNTKLYPSYFIKQLKKKEESNRNTA